jgi:galactonate dehydratase
MMRIVSLESRTVHVNQRGDWLHVILETDTGMRGFGEASHGGFGPDRDRIVEQILLHQVQPILRDCDPSRLTATMTLVGRFVDGLASATAVSATEQALQDLAGKIAGVSCSHLFGDACPDLVPLYANINRGVVDRHPEGFAITAREAADAGFRAIKLAPFDGIDQRRIREPEQRTKVRYGIDCVAAVREAVGGAVDVMVDCHSSFDPGTASMVAQELATLGVTWFEEPLPLTDIDAHVALRREVHRLGMELVGGELLYGVAGFLPWISSGAFDVVMPDVKHCGGMDALRSIGQLANACGVAVAPHNPSGPVSTIASGHALAGLDSFRALEYAYGEVRWRPRVIADIERVESGQLHLPDGPGLGIPDILDQAGGSREA